MVDGVVGDGVDLLEVVVFFLDFVVWVGGEELGKKVLDERFEGYEVGVVDGGGDFDWGLVDYLGWGVGCVVVGFFDDVDKVD